MQISDRFETLNPGPEQTMLHTHTAGKTVTNVTFTVNYDVKAPFMLHSNAAVFINAVEYEESFAALEGLCKLFQEKVPFMFIKPSI